jgi:hypothetical protein
MVSNLICYGSEPCSKSVEYQMLDCHPLCFVGENPNKYSSCRLVYGRKSYNVRIPIKQSLLNIHGQSTFAETLHDTKLKERGLTLQIGAQFRKDLKADDVQRPLLSSRRGCLLNSKQEMPSISHPVLLAYQDQEGLTRSGREQDGPQVECTSPLLHALRTWAGPPVRKECCQQLPLQKSGKCSI